MRPYRAGAAVNKSGHRWVTVIFEVWPPLVMTKQRVLAGTAATADLGAFLVWRWLD